MSDKEEQTEAPEGPPEKKGRGRPRKPKPDEVSIQIII